MLKTLSRRNAKRQMRDYIIYIITMVITVSLMLSFNMIVFSEEISAIIKQRSILPFIIVLTSIFVVLVMSALVSYITAFILKRRSKEFGLYMLLGIKNKDIARLFIRENGAIYGFVLIAGLTLGTVLYQAMKAVIYQMYAVPFVFSVELSTDAIVLTVVYMGMILCLVSARSERMIRKLNVRELLYYDKDFDVNKDGGIKGKIFPILVSVALGTVGFAIILLSVIRELPNGMYTLAIVLFAVATYGLFRFLLRHFLLRLNNVEWKYSKNRLFIFRQLITKIHSMLFLMAGVSILATLALLAINWGIYFVNTVDKRVDAVAFDVAPVL